MGKVNTRPNKHKALRQCCLDVGSACTVLAKLCPIVGSMSRDGCKHKGLVQCRTNVGPASTTVGQHCAIVGSMPRDGCDDV